MRRALAIIAAVVLAGSFASSGLAAESNPAPVGFVGQFEVLSPAGDPGGTLSAALWQQTEQRLVPGYFDFYAYMGPWPAEVHAQFTRSEFWFDETADGGSRVAFAEGMACLYYHSWREDATTHCQPFATMFVEVTNPTYEGPRHKVATALGTDENGDWIWDWWGVGQGGFVLT